MIRPVLHLVLIDYFCFFGVSTVHQESSLNDLFLTDLLFLESHNVEVVLHFRPRSLRPVLLALLFIVLIEVAKHKDILDLILPTHFPEIIKSIAHGALGGYKWLLHPRTSIKPRRIDVLVPLIVGFFVRLELEFHQTVLVRDYGTISVKFI